MTGISAKPMIPVSWGDVIDKLTILEIKARRLTEEKALANVRRELSALRQCASGAIEQAGMGALAQALANINETLWDAEETVRRKERSGTFDQEFIATARLIYARNEERARIKRQINQLLGSELVEEKNYRTAQPALAK